MNLCFKKKVKYMAPPIFCLFFQMSGATYVGKIYQSFGGVGRNVADCMSRLGKAPLFVSALGDDVHAMSLFNNCGHMVNSFVCCIF